MKKAYLIACLLILSSSGSFAQSGGNLGPTIGGAAGGIVRSQAIGAATGGAVGGGFLGGVGGGVVGGMTAPNSTATDDQEATHMLQGMQSQPSPFAPPQFDDNQ